MWIGLILMMVAFLLESAYICCLIIRSVMLGEISMLKGYIAVIVVNIGFWCMVPMIMEVA